MRNLEDALQTVGEKDQFANLEFIVNFIVSN